MKHCLINLSCITSLLLTSTVACKKNNNQSQPTATVYVAGIVPGTNGAVPAYWKNGIPNVLPSPSPYGAVTAMTTEGTDVYFAGYSNSTATNSVVTYWKNGQASVVQSYGSSAETTGIAVSGTDIYITGYNNALGGEPAPAYWKNGITDTLPPTGSHAEAKGVAISGTDVYVLGYDVSFLRTVVWKNGVMSSLGAAIPSAIAVADTNVYVVGDIGYAATIWKNGQPTPLGNSNPVYTASHANAIAVSGNNVYVAGYTVDPNGSGTDIATYWVNGKPITLDPGMATAICVSGSDVYVAGNIYNSISGFSPVYWKNGIKQSLQGNGTANAIGVIAP